MSAPQEPLPYGRQWVTEEEAELVRQALLGDWLTQGPAVERFEEALARRCGARHAVAVSSGTAALHLACLAARVGPGDLGLTAPITFVATANCVAYCGGTPGFVDVDPATVTMDPDALERACRLRPPRVVLPVDFAGQPAALPEIARIAREHGAVVIQDAAHSLGASYQSEGKWYDAGACAHADLAVLSFHPVKQITTGEGGAVLTNRPELHARLLELRTHGITRDRAVLERDDGPWYYEQRELGFNYRITDIQCTLGLAQLRRLDALVERRRELVRLYRERLAGMEDRLALLTESPGRRSSYHLLVARLRDGAEARLRVFRGLQERGIRPQVHYIPVHLQPYFRRLLGSGSGDYPAAEAYYAGCISLPLFPRMRDADVDRVGSALEELV